MVGKGLLIYIPTRYWHVWYQYVILDCPYGIEIDEKYLKYLRV